MAADHLQPDEVRRISLDAVRSVAGRPAEEVEAVLGLDGYDNVAWFIAVRFEQDPDRQAATMTRVHIAQAVRDALIEAGDEHYPFLRFLSGADWDSVQRARSACEPV